jgi:hypothetical protein
MNRRGFISKIVPAAVAAVALPSMREVAAETSKNLPDQEFYRGYRIVWLGWIEAVNQGLLYGKYLAVKDKQLWRVYSCYPGSTGKYWGDQIFEISVHHDQDCVDVETPKEMLTAYQFDAHCRLLKYIDGHFEELRG